MFYMYIVIYYHALIKRKITKKLYKTIEKITILTKPPTQDVLTVVIICVRE